mmetsp:Transcript_44126/g.88498  ORF Transcript_44126/g.88498 Transcript_44126/m.88498 type:complete len:120 (+) Transcript_44126:1427-1786(+)
MTWIAIIFGPKNTPWEGGIFKLLLKFTENYPEIPPIIRFYQNEICHPNIYQNGEICLDILQKRWSPIYTVSTILTSIQSLLCDPNPDSPANIKAADLYKKGIFDYNEKLFLLLEETWAI